MMVPLQISKSRQTCPPDHTVTTASLSRVACLSLWMATLFRRNVVANNNMIQLHLGVWPSHSVWCQLLLLFPEFQWVEAVSSFLFSPVLSWLPWTYVLPPHLCTFKQYITFVTYTIPYFGNWWNLVGMNLDSVVRKTRIAHIYPPLSLVNYTLPSCGEPQSFSGKISIKWNQSVTHSELSINVNFYYIYYF